MGWTIPIVTADWTPEELASRVRFESNDVIRIITEDERDILYELVPNQTEALYLSEVKVEKLFYIEGHLLASHRAGGYFQEMVQRNR